ncbi:oxidoreductase short-chain dehydrogenase reductase family protein [Rutstroemia sp. NJR-2017a BVV2]|nr:oxidoreductase short-chain dehydrogenase reductase family protein [Rutstroemia sp. NJR-2017a BVV2]
MSKIETAKTVLITGCSAGGSGSALAEVFEKRGLHVFATARTLSKMSHLKDLPNITLLELDITSSQSITTALDIVKAQTNGKLDYLVNNAGQSMVMPALDTDIEEAKKIFDVNYWGTIATIQAFAPYIIAAKGTIVNICSISGYVNAPWMSIYGASKAALMLQSETMRLELAPFQVKVLAVVSGVVATNIMSHGNDWKLPPQSLYSKVSKAIEARATGADVKASQKMDPKKFANKVVTDVLSGASGRTWRGSIASVVWLMTLLPTYLMDKAMLSGTSVQ